MELKDTIIMMTSENFKERLKAEYWQTKIRYDKLHKMLIKYEAGNAWTHLPVDRDDACRFLGFKPECDIGLLREQERIMGEYLHLLEIRSVVEGIDLDEYY